MSKSYDSSLWKINSHLEISLRNHKKGPVVPSHWHDYFEFEIVTEGLYRHTISGKIHSVERGSAWIMTYLDYHSVDSLEDSSLINISFTSKEISSEILSILLSSPGGFLCKFDEKTTKLIISMCEKAKQELEGKDLFWKNSVKGLVENIIIETIRKSGVSSLQSGKKTPVLLQSVISFINTEYNNDISIAAAAKKFAISPGRLGLLFSKNFGISYNEYVNRVRLRHACNLLSSTELSAKQIAFECGYRSTEYFFYVFKKELGTTPGKFRNGSSNNL